MAFDTRLDRDFFAPSQSLQSGFLDCADKQKIYWEASGNPQGIPVLYLHGGPGAGLSPMQRRYFDPKAFRVILFDQRGAGRSKPHALQIDNLAYNNTQALIGDMEALRLHLGIESWLLVGGSWGSTLATAYAQTYPEHCLGLILRSFFSGTQTEIEHFLTGTGSQHPEAQYLFLKAIGYSPEDYPSANDILERYWKAFHSESQHKDAVETWVHHECACASLRYQPQKLNVHSATSSAIALLEAHYMRNHCFLAPDQLFLNMHKLAHLPIFIVQGRHDRICPPKEAWRFAQANANIRLRIIEAAAHSVSDTPLRIATMGAIETMKQHLSKNTGL